MENRGMTRQLIRTQSGVRRQQPEDPPTEDFATYDTLPDVLSADSTIFQLLVTRDRAHGAGWSNIYESDDGKEFGLTHSPDVDTFITSTSPKFKKVKRTNFHKRAES